MYLDSANTRDFRLSSHAAQVDPQPDLESKASRSVGGRSYAAKRVLS